LRTQNSRLLRALRQYPARNSARENRQALAASLENSAHLRAKSRVERPLRHADVGCGSSCPALCRASTSCSPDAHKDVDGGGETRPHHTTRAFSSPPPPT